MSLPTHLFFRQLRWMFVQPACFSRDHLPPLALLLLLLSPFRLSVRQAPIILQLLLLRIGIFGWTLSVAGSTPLFTSSPLLGLSPLPFPIRFLFLLLLCLLLLLLLCLFLLLLLLYILHFRLVLIFLWALLRMYLYFLLLF